MLGNYITDVVDPLKPEFAFRRKKITAISERYNLKINIAYKKNIL